MILIKKHHPAGEGFRDNRGDRKNDYFGTPFLCIQEVNIWYNIDRYYTCADLRSTEGRTTTANRVHPAEHSMSEGHGINCKSR